MQTKENGLVSKAKKYAARASVVVGSVLASGAAMAQTADVSDAIGGFTAAGTAIGSVGEVMVGAAAAGIVYRWVTAFLVK